MKYIFYGQHLEKNYSPKILDYYGAKVPTLGEWNSLKSWEKFYEKDNISVELKGGSKVTIEGESVYIKSVEYDVSNDVYNVYTEKVLSISDGNMSKEVAEIQLENIRNKGVSGFFRQLFGG